MLSLPEEGNQFPCKGDLICRPRACIHPRIDRSLSHTHTLTDRDTEQVICMRLNGWSKGRAVPWTLRSLWVPLPPPSSAFPNILCHFPSCCLSTSEPSFNLQLCLSLFTVLDVGGLPSLHTVRCDCRVIKKAETEEITRSWVVGFISLL